LHNKKELNLLYKPLENPMNRMMKFISMLLFILVFSISSMVSAGTIPAAKPEEVGFSSDRLQRIHELMQRNIDDGNFAGAVTLVARQGRIAHLEAHGMMDLEAKKPMEKNAIFRIMSMTKPVVGVSVLMLLEEGKIRLNDPASKFIPQLKELKVAVPLPDAPASPFAPLSPAPRDPRFYTMPADREITIRDLLTHTSGMVSGPISMSQNAKVIYQKGETVADYISRLGSVPLEFQPGTKWAYSAQAGIDTLVRIVEIVSGQTYDQFLKHRVLEPLDMKDTSFYPDEAHKPRIATLYRKTPEGLQKQNNPAFMNGTYLSGGGGLFSTAEDYLRFGQMLANGGELDGHRILGRRTVEMMRSVHIPDTLPGRNPGEGYGLTVRVIQNSGAAGTALSNGSFGWSGAFGTHFWVDPKEKIVAVLMTQGGSIQLTADFEMAVMQAVID
jgi:CubicO group peptidase (beta-lactamase class C family)